MKSSMMLIFYSGMKLIWSITEKSEVVFQRVAAAQPDLNIYSKKIKQ